MRTLVLCACCVLAGAPAMAQRDYPSNYNVRSLSFDLWCQQTQSYPADRCARRAPDDVKAFEEYRAAVERFEIDYLKQRERERELQDRQDRDPFSPR